MGTAWRARLHFRGRFRPRTAARPHSSAVDGHRRAEHQTAAMLFHCPGATPWLEQQHSIFGEVTEGKDIAKYRQDGAFGPQDRPVKDLASFREDSERLRDRSLEPEREPGIQSLMPPVYDELRGSRRLPAARRRPTLQATALVHRGLLRHPEKKQPWKNRTHFLSIAARRCGRNPGARAAPVSANRGQGPSAIALIIRWWPIGVCGRPSCRCARLARRSKNAALDPAAG